MINYKVSIKNPAQHFIQFEMSFEVKDDKDMKLQLPVWRPGRYEFGSFAKNIKGFSVSDEKGKVLKYEKIEHSKWLIYTAKSKIVKVSYEYFANELNAGSTFLDNDQLYINPVNCFFYLPEYAPHKYEVNFVLPKKYKIACSLKKKGNHGLLAKDHWELFDSPLIASDNYQKKSFKVDKTLFHIVFQGICKPDWDLIIKDFTKFTKKQIQCFGSFPVKEYYYYVHTPNHRQYHGVEHEKSTVITLGPGYLLMSDKIYDDLLGVCSHELYHTWNVKNIKPKEFSPLDFSKENYNRVGYIIEGVTTYMGDKMLWQSGVRNEDWFRNEMASQYKKHMWNDGRYNHSVRDSSFDTWLDGYVAGIPGRKVSIYTEGALLALILDVEIQDKSNERKSLDTVMKKLYENYGSSKDGYDESDFWGLVEEVHGKSLNTLYNNFHDKAVSYEGKVKSALKKMKWKISEDNSDILRSSLGLIVDGSNKVTKVHSKSDAYSKGVGVGDTIIAINDQVINNNLNHWLEFYSSDSTVDLLIGSKSTVNRIKLKKAKSLFPEYSVVRMN